MEDYCPHCKSTDPGEKLFCQHCNYHIPGRNFSSSYTPPWGVFERSMHSSDPETQKAATDAFLATRARETAVSAKARHWEKSRKAGWAKDKPKWRKKKAI